MKWACVLLSIFAAFVLAAALVDVVPAFRTWFGRIGIGRSSLSDVLPKLRAVAVRQLRHTPSVPISDQTRFTLPERLRGAYKSKKIQSWQQAALLLGVAESGNADAVYTFRRSVLTPDGDWNQPPQSADAAFLAYALLYTADDPTSVRPAMDKTYADLQSRVVDGTIPYTPHSPKTRFVDAVGMTCPFLYLYGKTYDCPEAISLCIAQLSEYAEKGLHPTLGLPVHAFRLTDNAPLGVYGWGRGCGWYALALAELTRCGADVQTRAVPFAKAVLSAQQKTGAFSRQLLAERGTESSATAMLGHFLAVQGAYLPVCRDAARNAMRSLVGATRKDGTVDMAQGDTKGVGFYSTRFMPLPAAQGFALLLAEELQ